MSSRYSIDPHYQISDSQEIYLADISLFNQWNQLTYQGSTSENSHTFHGQSIDGNPFELIIARPGQITAEKQALERLNSLAVRHPFKQENPLRLESGTCDDGRHAWLVIDWPNQPVLLRHHALQGDDHSLIGAGNQAALFLRRIHIQRWPATKVSGRSILQPRSINW
jgi:hypothetical protein